MQNASKRLPCAHASAITPIAALLLQWVRTLSPSLMRLAPSLPMVFRAFLERLTKRSAFSITRIRYSSAEVSLEVSLKTYCTPFHRDMAVGREAKSRSRDLSTLERISFRSLPW